MGMLRDRTFDFVARQVELIEFMIVSGEETSKKTSLNMIISDLNALDITDGKTVVKHINMLHVVGLKSSNTTSCSCYCIIFLMYHEILYLLSFFKYFDFKNFLIVMLINFSSLLPAC